MSLPSLASWPEFVKAALIASIPSEALLRGQVGPSRGQTSGICQGRKPGVSTALCVCSSSAFSIKFRFFLLVHHWVPGSSPLASLFSSPPPFPSQWHYSLNCTPVTGLGACCPLGLNAHFFQCPLIQKFSVTILFNATPLLPLSSVPHFVFLC